MEMDSYETFTINDFDKVCRICLSVGNLTSINELSEKILNVVQNCFQLNFIEDASLPQNICINCRNKVMDFVRFHKLCRTSNNFLRSVLEQDSEANTLNCIKQERNPDESNFDGQLFGIYDAFDTEDIKIFAIEETTEIPSSKKSKQHTSRRKGNRKMSHHTVIVKGKDGTKIYKCRVCKKTYANMKAMNEHTLSHYDSEKFYTCQFCNRIFPRETQLVSHIRVHTGEKPYGCDYCEKTFAQNCSLKIHIRTHTGEKPFPCVECGRRFAQRMYLKTHMRIHTGERPFKCDVCDRAFSQQSAMKSHRKIHEREMAKIQYMQELLDLPEVTSQGQ